MQWIDYELNTEEHVMLLFYEALTSADTENRKETPCSSNKEQETKKVNPSSEERVRPKGSTNSLSKASKYKSSVYEIGPPSWVQKEMNYNSNSKASCKDNHFPIDKSKLGIGLKSH